MTSAPPRYNTLVTREETVDVKIEIYAWDLGYDESHELMQKIADTLRDRGLGYDETDGNHDKPVRSVLFLKPAELTRGYEGEPETEDGVPEGLNEFLTEAMEGATVVLIPGAEL